MCGGPSPEQLDQVLEHPEKYKSSVVKAALKDPKKRKELLVDGKLFIYQKLKQDPEKVQEKQPEIVPPDLRSDLPLPVAKIHYLTPLMAAIAFKDWPLVMELSGTKAYGHMKNGDWYVTVVNEKESGMELMTMEHTPLLECWKIRGLDQKDDLARTLIRGFLEADEDAFREKLEEMLAEEANGSLYRVESRTHEIHLDMDEDDTMETGDGKAFKRIIPVLESVAKLDEERFLRVMTNEIFTGMLLAVSKYQPPDESETLRQRMLSLLRKRYRLKPISIIEEWDLLRIVAEPDFQEDRWIYLEQNWEKISGGMMQFDWSLFEKEAPDLGYMMFVIRHAEEVTRSGNERFHCEKEIVCHMNEDLILEALKKNVITKTQAKRMIKTAFQKKLTYAIPALLLKQSGEWDPHPTPKGGKKHGDQSGGI